MSDLRPGRKSNRQAELSALEHATDSLPVADTEDRDELDESLSGVAKTPESKKAYKSAKLNARSQIRTATAIAGTLIMRLDAALGEYVAACNEAANCTTKARSKLERIAEAKRLQLGELRRTCNVMGPLNTVLLKAGKVVHDADLDRLLRSVTITGTSHFDDLCTGIGDDK